MNKRTGIKTDPETKEREYPRNKLMHTCSTNFDKDVKNTQWEATQSLTNGFGKTGYSTAQE